MAPIRISTYILRRARGASAALGAAYNLVDNAENSSYAEAPSILRPLDEPGRFGRVTRASACELFSALSTGLWAAPRAADAALARSETSYPRPAITLPMGLAHHGGAG